MKEDKYRSDAVLQNLHAMGYKATIVPIENIIEVKRNFNELVLNNIIDKEFYQKELSSFFKSMPDSASSILIIAFPSFITNVYFKVRAKNIKTIIPPHYIHKTSTKNIINILNKKVGLNNYMAIKNNLPLKYLAVKSGLGKYGKNNICYVEGMGSYLRLAGFFLRDKAQADTWKDFTMLERCKTCTNCIKICPTKAITEDRFIIRAERCLTYFNEDEKNFPSWIKKEWHNSLVGCIRCQKVCPENKDFNYRIEADYQFDEFETENILKHKSAEGLDKNTIKKISKIGFENEIFILSRNLGSFVE
jgi:epoxyqueuosine reductase